MIDLHSHTFFTDGALIPSELVRYAAVIGYKALAITDHVDASNFDFVVKRIIKVSEALNRDGAIKVIPGAEITHVPPAMIGGLAKEIRALGAELILVHGETVSEPVIKGTNLSAVRADINILAHPGLVDDDTARIAKERGIYFEISARKGHSLTNGHVANMAQMHGVKLVVNSDTHQCGDLLTKEMAKKVLLGAGIPGDQIESIFLNSVEIVKNLK